jgi:hypothetical protein
MQARLQRIRNTNFDRVGASKAIVSLSLNDQLPFGCLRLPLFLTWRRYGRRARAFRCGASVQLLQRFNQILTCGRDGVEIEYIIFEYGYNLFSSQ